MHKTLIERLFAGPVLGSPAHGWQEAAPGTRRRSRDPMVSGNGSFIDYRCAAATNGRLSVARTTINDPFPLTMGSRLRLHVPGVASCYLWAGLPNTGPAIFMFS